jgi:hypothetical protein
VLSGVDQLPDGLRPVTLRMPVRAPRVGVFVPSHPDIPWQRCFEAVLAKRTGHWGGVGDLVFPSELELVDHELFWRIADAFDADVYMGDRISGSDLREVHPAALNKRRAELRQQWPTESLEGFLDDETFADAMIPPEFNALLVRRLAPLHLIEDVGETASAKWRTGFVPDLRTRDLADLPREVAWFRTDLGATQSLLLTSQFGRLDPPTKRGLAEQGIAVVDKTIETSGDLARLLYRDSSQHSSPWLLAQLGLDLYGRMTMSSRSPTIIVGDDAWDFALFYALHRMTLQALWLPSEVEADPHLWLGFQARIKHLTQQLGVRVHVTSYSDQDGAARVTALLRSADVSRESEACDWRELIPAEPTRLYETGNEGHAQTSLIYGGETPQLPTPVPINVRHREEWKTSWLVEARIDGWVGLRHPDLAGDVLADPGLHIPGHRQTLSGATFVATGVVSYPSPLASLVVRPRLRPRNLAAQIQQIAQASRWTCSISDKGAYARRAADVFGGLLPLRDVLADAMARKVFYAYLTAKTKDMADAPGRWIANETRRALELSDFKNLLGLDAAHALVDRWRSTEALQLGAILKCRRCRQATWYDVEAFGRSFRCARCWLEQRGDTFSWLGKPEPQWSYRLDEAITQFLIHDGDLAVAAAAQAIENSDQPIDCAFELNLTRDSDDSASEHDIFLSEGARLWVGEATRSARLETAKADQNLRLERLRAVADLLGARYVLLASSTAWDHTTCKAAKHHFPSAWPELKWMTDVPWLPRPTKVVS